MNKLQKKDSLTIIEHSILVFIWGVVFIIPVLLQLNEPEIEWFRIKGNWIRLSPYLILSFLNHFVLFPLLFVKQRKYWYVAGACLTIITFTFVLSVIQKPAKRVVPAQTEQALRLHEPPPQQNFPGWRPGGRIEDQAPKEPTSGALPPFMNSVLIAFLIMGFDTGLRTIFKWTKTENEKEVLEKEKVKSELAFLRTQVNPHFLMNALNNIHALIEFDTDEAKDTVIRLSKLMRYLLYDTERELIPIREELIFIRSYVELMIMRISKRVNVDLNIEMQDEEKQIPPLLFTSLIENAFKYGVSHMIDTFIKIDFKSNEKELCCEISNTITQKSSKSAFYSGIGLENTRKRLDILYGNRYSMDTTCENDVYLVKLKLPL